MSERMVLTTQGVRHGCQRPHYFLISTRIDEIRTWKSGADCGFKLNNFRLWTFLHADDQILLSVYENYLQNAFYALVRIVDAYNLSIFLMEK